MVSHRHVVLFRCPGIAIKRFESWSPRDVIGFDYEYEAARISLVRTGVFRRVIRGALLLADPTQVVFVNRGDVHRFVYPLDGGNVCTVLEPSRELLEELMWNVGVHERFPTDQTCVTSRLARRHFELLRFLNAGDRFGAEEIAVELSFQALVLSATTSLRRIAGPAVERQRQIVERARLILNANLQQPPTLAALARALSCSTFHLSRIFSVHAGMPMRSYLLRLRTTEAARRILDGASDLASLAIDFGFYDHSHFTNAFTDMWGLSPSAFRASWTTISKQPGQNVR